MKIGFSLLSSSLNTIQKNASQVLNLLDKKIHKIALACLALFVVVIILVSVDMARRKYTNQSNVEKDKQTTPPATPLPDTNPEPQTPINEIPKANATPLEQLFQPRKQLNSDELD